MKAEGKKGFIYLLIITHPPYAAGGHDQSYMNS